MTMDAILSNVGDLIYLLNIGYFAYLGIIRLTGYTLRDLLNEQF